MSSTDLHSKDSSLKVVEHMWFSHPETSMKTVDFGCVPDKDRFYSGDVPEGYIFLIALDSKSHLV